MADTERWRSYGALCILWILVGFTKLTRSDEVVLLDTRKSESLNWQTNPQEPSNSQHRGWREASYPVDNGDIYRIYYACNVAQEKVNNWIRLPYIERGAANRLYFEINFTMRRCQLYPDPSVLHQCKESFKLLYYEADSDFANAEMPTWDNKAYTHIDVIAADRTITKNINAYINTETRSVAVTKKGVYFAMVDEGACTTMISVRIYYKMCTSKTVNFATFPNTTTGKESTEVVQQYGSCIDHAAIQQQPKVLCMADGKWSYFEGGCKCMPGYEPQSDTKCNACQPGTYKWETGDSVCESCPAFSEAPEKGAVECSCVPGYYRAFNDDKSRQCTRPPSKPRNVSVLFYDQTTVIIDWMQPESLGGRDDLSYRIACYPCKQTQACEPCETSVMYNPKKYGFNTSKVTIRGLNPNTFYTFQVFAENGVTGAHSQLVYQNISLLTKPAIPARVNNVQIAYVGLNTVTLVWSRPSESASRTELYEVKWYPTRNRNNASSDQVRHENYTFHNLQLQTEYSFQVRHKTDKGWGKFSQAVRTTTGHLLETGKNDITSKKPDQDNPIPIIAGSIVAVAMCMAIVIVMVVIFLRRNHRSCNEKTIIHCPPIDGAQVINGTLTVPLFTPPPGGIRTYVDPHTYEDPNQAVREFTKEIDASCITIESVIGGGEFGDVCKGRLRVAMRGDLTVAIKTLKAGASDKNRLDFLTEASIMGQFEDPNVIYLEGVVTKSHPIMIVTEFMENGSMDTFLRNNDGKFTVMQLVGMMRGIASGMRYLSDMGYVHRDLAARNILVNENLVCKVADFGLSREIEADTTDGAYTTKGGKIPVRWTAPEAIAYRKFTSASDVWSYGVVMWEVMSYGERPYWNWSNQDVIKAVDKSYRLPPPMECPESLHQLMLDCWQKERGNRPKFGIIVKTLDKLIRAPELLRKLAKQKPCNYFDPNMPDMTQIGSIEEWLIGIKMERYIEYFISAGYLTMDHIAHITLKDLVELGITLVGHQKKILNSVQTLRAQMEICSSTEGLSHQSHGFLV